VRLAALLSGGKDSTYSIYIARQYGWEVSDAVILLTDADSYMFQRPNTREAVKIAEAMGLKLHVKHTEGVEEDELQDMKEALSIPEIDGVLVGAVESDYQWARVQRICHELGIRTFAPLWRKDQEMLVRDMVSAGFRIMIVSVSAYGLGEEWLGRIIDERAIENLVELREKYGINVGGEGGEYETTVIGGPGFAHDFEAVIKERHWHRDSGWVEVKLIPNSALLHKQFYKLWCHTFW